jgi:hypothetical protein
MIHAYIGLLRADGTEPDKASGYRRVAVEAKWEDSLCLVKGSQIVFPDVTAPGYGVISTAAVYEQNEGGEPVFTYPLPEALDVHQGVVPVLHRGRLWRGVETRATITVTPGIRSAAGGLRK